MSWHTTPEEQKPLSEMPIWARLAFMEMIPKTYFWDEEMTKPRVVQDAVITGFERFGDVIWIHYDIRWPAPNAGIHRYVWPCYMPWTRQKEKCGCWVKEYSLTPLNDPTAFNEKRDQRSYHLCDLPQHNDHVPFPYAQCYQYGAWTWESRYAR